jgi:AmmeMemoRadiSam system protein A
MSSTLPAEARRELLAIARGAIAARLAGRSGPSTGTHPRLREPGGAFVTLSVRETGELRGCVGYVEALFPVGETVARAAVAAAFDDDRFAPVLAEELSSLSVDVSVLQAPRPIRAAEVEVGRDGLIVARGGFRGLLLPQVPVEHGWSREAFLEHTCRKAGLPKDAWRDERTELLAFAAEVFGEGDVTPAG